MGSGNSYEVLGLKLSATGKNITSLSFCKAFSPIDFSNTSVIECVFKQSSTLSGRKTTMAIQSLLDALNQGVDHWNRLRRNNPGWPRDLREAKLSGKALAQADLSNMDLTRSDLSDACLAGADLSGLLAIHHSQRGRFEWRQS